MIMVYDSRTDLTLMRLDEAIAQLHQAKDGLAHALARAESDSSFSGNNFWPDTNQSASTEEPGDHA